MAAASTSNGHTAVRLALLLAAAVTLFALITYYNGKKKKGGNERFSADALGTPGMLQTPMAPMGMGMGTGTGLMPPPAPSGPATSARGGGVADAAASFNGPAPVEPLGNEMYLPVAGASAGNQAPVSPFPQDRITPEQLLPKDAANSKWAQANPAGQGDVKDQSFLTSGYHLGFDTQGNSLRNASHDIRSTPPNPRYRVSIWQASTIESDLNRRPLE